MNALGVVTLRGAPLGIAGGVLGMCVFAMTPRNDDDRMVGRTGTAVGHFGFFSTGAQLFLAARSSSTSAVPSAGG